MALYAFDGTWNKPDTDEDSIDKNTNVYNFLKFYATDDPETLSKLEEYKTGVGTRLGAGGRIVGGFFGGGGRDRVREMVESFAENWAHNGPEDRTVDVIGFSRGAALALHFCNKLAKGVEVKGEAEKVKPKIRFLGVWDVVPSFGLPGILVSPLNEINIGWDLDVPSCVEHCFHAMALDERRGAFNVYRLDPENDDAPQIEERWFRGVHSDVGGGNGNVLLGNISLTWMLEQAHATGLPIAMDKVAELKTSADAKVSPSDFQGRWQDRAVKKGDRFHESAGKRLAAGESAQVEVDSKLWFDFSGILIEEGAQYCFTPDSAGKWKDKTIECDASGWPADLNRGRTVFGWLKEKVLESHAVGMTRRVPDANWFEMVAAIGASGKPAVPIGHGQHAQKPWTADASGLLFFFANDARGMGHNFYDNNDGTINVTVKRVA
jgi:uncharacterized protein (DUF2235 family)